MLTVSEPRLLALCELFRAGHADEVHDRLLANIVVYVTALDTQRM
jgi:hypothetical protein